MKPFAWLDGTTVTISVTSTSSNTPFTVGKMPTGECQLRFYNGGLVPVFIHKGFNGNTAVALVASDMPIAPGSVEVLTVINDPSNPLTSLGAITGTSTATLYVTIGAGQ